MEVFKVVGFGIISVILIVILKEEKKEFALILTILSGVLLLIYIVTKLTPVIDMLNN